MARGITTTLAALPLAALGTLGIPGPSTHPPSPAGADTLTRARKVELTDSLFAGLNGLAVPGCAVGVVDDGRLAFERGYGAANLDYGVPLDGRSSFYLASVSKQFVGAAIGLLALDGRIDLDDEVGRYIPEFPDYGDPVTIRHLVHHVSGVRDYLTLFSIAGRSFQDFFDNDDAVELITRQRALNFEPGSEHLYSNSGYVLLAEVVERVSGESLDAFSRRRLFEPLGMFATHWGEDVSRIVSGRAVSYRRGDDGRHHRFIWNFHGKGDGNLHSTVEDLARWDTMFYRTDEPWASLVELMYTRGRLSGGEEIDYAFGLSHGEYRDRPTISHGGGMLGYRTFLLRFPGERLTTIALCNGASSNPGLWSRRLADVWLFGGTFPEASASRERRGKGPPTDRPSEDEQWEPGDPSTYAGEYYSPELDATFVLAVEDGALVRRPPRGPAVPLSPTEPDVFRVGGQATLTFEREGGRLVGFTLDAGRVRGLRFESR